MVLVISVLTDFDDGDVDIVWVKLTDADDVDIVGVKLTDTDDGDVDIGVES